MKIHFLAPIILLTGCNITSSSTVTFDIFLTVLFSSITATFYLTKLMYSFKRNAPILYKNTLPELPPILPMVIHYSILRALYYSPLLSYYDKAVYCHLRIKYIIDLFHYSDESRLQAAYWFTQNKVPEDNELFKFAFSSENNPSIKFILQRIIL